MTQYANEQIEARAKAAFERRQRRNRTVMFRHLTCTGPNVTETGAKEGVCVTRGRSYTKFPKNTLNKGHLDRCGRAKREHIEDDTEAYIEYVTQNEGIPATVGQIIDGCYVTQ